MIFYGNETMNTLIVQPISKPKIYRVQYLYQGTYEWILHYFTLHSACIHVSHHKTWYSALHRLKKLYEKGEIVK